MPDPALSQRAAAAKLTRTFFKLGIDEISAFVKAVGQAKNFNDLPQKWQDLIVEAEKKKPDKDPDFYRPDAK